MSPSRRSGPRPLRHHLRLLHPHPLRWHPLRCHPLHWCLLHWRPCRRHQCFHLHFRFRFRFRLRCHFHLRFLRPTPSGCRRRQSPRRSPGSIPATKAKADERTRPVHERPATGRRRRSRRRSQAKGQAPQPRRSKRGETSFHTPVSKRSIASQRSRAGPGCSDGCESSDGAACGAKVRREEEGAMQRQRTGYPVAASTTWSIEKDHASAATISACGTGTVRASRSCGFRCRRAI